MRPILYVCGPYTGTDSTETTKNVMTARSYAIEAWRRGWTVFCPHLNSAHFERCIPEIRHDGWINAYLDILRRLDPDAVLLIEGWSGSPGAVFEYTTARDELRTEILGPFHSPDEMPRAPKLCPVYRQVHYETDSRDTCGSSDRRCPAGVSCPIRRRCR
jgi:hypothetical protein